MIHSGIVLISIVHPNPNGNHSAGPPPRFAVPVLALELADDVCVMGLDGAMLLVCWVEGKGEGIVSQKRRHVVV